MAEETLGSHPEGLVLLEMSFVLWGCQAVLCSQGFRRLRPPLQTQQSLWIQPPDVRLKKGYNARDLIFLFVFTAAKSLLNKKSDGGVKVGVSTLLAGDRPLSPAAIDGDSWHLIPLFPWNPSRPCFSA